MTKFLNKFIYLSHWGFGVFWCSLLFLPATWWPEKITFNFFFSITIIGHQLLWGIFIKLRTGKFRPTCILTTITQKLRGFSLTSPENYEYSFTKEMFGRIGISVPQVVVRLLALAIFMTATIQYILLG
jgi:hypothetical protein